MTPVIIKCIDRNTGRESERAQFMGILIQLRFLASQADDETRDYYRRELLRAMERMRKCGEKVKKDTIAA